MANRFGGFLANLLSVGTRGLGYFLWGLLRIVYRGDIKMIALFASVIGAVALVIWLALR